MEIPVKISNLSTHEEESLTGKNFAIDTTINMLTLAI